MKVNYGEHLKSRTQVTALRNVNRSIRAARASAVRELSIPMRQRFQYAMRRIRQKVFVEAGMLVPVDREGTTRKERGEFCKTLSIEARAAIFRRMSEEVIKVAKREKLPQVVELEKIRINNLSGVVATLTDEDGFAVTQMTHDLIDNVKTKYAKPKSNR